MSIAILPLATWAAGTNQNSIPANDNALRIELLSRPIISKTTTAQPVSPADGDCYIIPAGKTGAQWATFTIGDLTIYRGGTWYAFAPVTGLIVTVNGTREIWNSGWSAENLTGGPGFSGEITGLVMSWNSGTSLTVGTGSAHIQSTGRVLAASAAITKSGLSLSNDTTYHLYMYSNAGTPDVEVVTTAPAAAYSGTARSKTGDTTRRYLGSVRTNGSAAVRKFIHTGDRILWQENTTASPYRVLAGGTSTAWTAIPMTAVVPPTSRVALVGIQIVGGSVGTDISSEAAGGGFFTTLNPAQFGTPMLPIDATQNLYYKAPASGAGLLFVDVWGYTFER